MNHKLKRILYLWGPAVIWAGVIFALSSFSTLPSAQTVASDFIFKKSAHMTVYAILYFLAFRALNAKTIKNYKLAFIICILYAISDEIHQSFTPGRHPKITDIGFDTLGMTVTFLRLTHFI